VNLAKTTLPLVWHKHNALQIPQPQERSKTPLQNRVRFPRPLLDKSEAPL
jgi:hypothetical protein